jgi:sarcosine oxidase subunit alpha
VTIAPHFGEGRLGSATTTIDCDVLGMSGGWSPTIHLWSQAGGSLKYDAMQLSLRPDACAQAVRVAGSANGAFSVAAVLEEGAAAGHWAAGSTVELTQSATEAQAVRAPEALWYTRDARSDKQWVDFQYDVKVADLELAHRENFRSVEHVKRYTTNGMSVDQGKTSNINALAVMAELSGRPIPEVGTTKFRPPYQPVTIGAFAGRHIGKQYAPSLRMPGQDWHVERGGHFADFGGWQRPEYYPQNGEDEAAATRREARAVRKSVGIFEGSPLGKIEVRGPDAAAFLNLVYINNAATLKVNAARYGLMCNENGVVIDDGVFVRLADDHFLLHTTSGGAGRIFQWLEEWLQCEWTNLKVFVTNVTSQWANVTLSGPNAHKVLAKCDSGIDFTPDAFRHMQFRSGEIFGVPTRVLRASFTGEASYEINVPARYGYALLHKLEALGEEFDITPYGVESLMTLRAEKGYLHIGADTDGTTNPMDLGWGGAIAKKPGDFIGRRSLSRPVDQSADRLHFVGLQSLNPATPLPLGGHVISTAQPAFPVASEGYVTSACISPNLNKAIGLGIVRRGRERLGEQVYIYAAGKTVAAVITSPTHIDPEGSALSA